MKETPKQQKPLVVVAWSYGTLDDTLQSSATL